MVPVLISAASASCRIVTPSTPDSETTSYTTPRTSLRRLSVLGRAESIVPTSVFFEARANSVPVGHAYGDNYNIYTSARVAANTLLRIKSGKVAELAVRQPVFKRARRQER